MSIRSTLSEHHGGDSKNRHRSAESCKSYSSAPDVTGLLRWEDARKGSKEGKQIDWLLTLKKFGRVYENWRRSLLSCVRWPICSCGVDLDRDLRGHHGKRDRQARPTSNRCGRQASVLREKDAASTLCQSLGIRLRVSRSKGLFARGHAYKKEQRVRTNLNLWLAVGRLAESYSNNYLYQ